MYGRTGIHDILVTVEVEVPQLLLLLLPQLLISCFGDTLHIHFGGSRKIKLLLSFYVHESGGRRDKNPKRIANHSAFP